MNDIMDFIGGKVAPMLFPAILVLSALFLAAYLVLQKILSIIRKKRKHRAGVLIRYRRLKKFSNKKRGEENGKNQRSLPYRIAHLKLRKIRNSKS